MKEALVLADVFPRATARPPQLPVSEHERELIGQAMEEGQLLDSSGSI
jgi:hypothetical protein